MMFADDDEFDSYDTVGTAEPLCQARAIYDYAAVQYDELTIKPGIVPLLYDYAAVQYDELPLNQV